MFRHVTPLSSRVVEGVSGVLLSLGRKLGLFLEVQQGRQTSLCVVRGYLGFHSSRFRAVRPYLELRGNLVSLKIVSGMAGFLSSFNS